MTERNQTESQRARAMVSDAAVVAADLIAHDLVGARWDEPSALDGMTVGALAAHLVRATGATLAYLDRTPAGQTSDDPLTKVTYFHAAIDSPIHERIKEVSASEAEIGHDELARKAHNVAAQLAERLPTEPVGRQIGALGDRMITLDDFCRTRMIEIGMHIDDLAHSIGVPTPELDADVTAEIIDIVVGIGRHLHGDWAIIHALARGERASAETFPVF